MFALIRNRMLMRIRAKKNSFEEPRYTTAQKPQSTVASFRTWQGLKEFSCIGPELIERVYTERRGFEPLVPFGTQPFQDCTLNRSDISPRFEKKGFHAEAFLLLKKLGFTLNYAISVSNPQSGSRTERGGFGLLSHTSCMLHPTRLRLLPRTSCALFLALLGVASVSNPCKGAKRREGDSNPRILADQRFSRPPESTALASLQAFTAGYLTVRD